MPSSFLARAARHGKQRHRRRTGPLAGASKPSLQVVDSEVRGNRHRVCGFRMTRCVRRRAIVC